MNMLSSRSDYHTRKFLEGQFESIERRNWSELPKSAPVTLLAIAVTVANMAVIAVALFLWLRGPLSL